MSAPLAVSWYFYIAQQGSLCVISEWKSIRGALNLLSKVGTEIKVSQLGEQGRLIIQNGSLVIRELVVLWIRG